MLHEIFRYIRKESEQAFNAYLYQEKPRLEEIIYKKENSSSSYYGSSSSSHADDEEAMWEGYTPFHMIVALKAETKWAIFWKYFIENYINQLKDDQAKKQALRFIFDKPNINGLTPFHTYVALNLSELNYIFQLIINTFGKETFNFKACTFYEKNEHRTHQNAIHLTVKNHNALQILNFLIQDLGLDYKLQDANGLSPIHIAAIYKNFAAIEILLNLDSRLLYKTTDDGDTILHILAEKNDVDSLKKLHPLSVNYQVRNSDSLTPLHCAAATLSYQAIYYLISEQNVCIDWLCHKNNYTPMHYVVDSFSKKSEISETDTNKLVECFSLFIHYGFDPNAYFSSAQSFMLFAKNKLKSEHYKLLHEKTDELAIDIMRHRLSRNYLNTDIRHLDPQQQQILYLKMKETMLLFAAQTLDHSHYRYIQELLSHMETHHPTLKLLPPMLFSSQPSAHTSPPTPQNSQPTPQYENPSFRFGH